MSFWHNVCIAYVIHNIHILWINYTNPASGAGAVALRNDSRPGPDLRGANWAVAQGLHN